MGIRLMILMAMGLGALYMLHLLAQDYNQIRQPVAAATRALTSASGALLQWRQRQGRGKRNTDNTMAQIPHNNTEYMTHTNETSYQKANETIIIVNTAPKVDWKRILSRDPFDCLLSLICQVMSGAESNSYEAIMLMDYLETSLEVAPARIGHAFSLGLRFRGATERCYDQYPFCIYSASTMMRVLKWFSGSDYGA